MTPADYIRIASAMSAENPNNSERTLTARDIQMLHAAMGLSKETGEIVDIMSRHLFYDEPVHYEKLCLEMGDVCWYMAVLCDRLQISFEQLWDMNIKKLRARYPTGYSHERALNRTDRTDHDQRLDVADLAVSLASVGLPVIVVDLCGDEQEIKHGAD